jgi:HisA/HisF family protein
MEVIPVVDLKGGVVVRARTGERASYRPIETPLSATSEPLDVIAGLLSLHPFRTLYVADLDAIEGRGSAKAILDRIAQEYPHLSLWVDNGCADQLPAHAFLARFGNAALVLGSESQRDSALVGVLGSDPRIILSLDFRADGFIGPPALLREPALWPPRLIVMTLAKVGSGEGPDFARAGEIQRRAGDRSVYFAGGLRDRDDLEAVKASGAAGILVASALHDGKIDPADLAALTT